MMAAPNAYPLLPKGATALEIPSDRPAFYNSFTSFRAPTSATAVRLVTLPSERRTSMTVYMPPPTPEGVYFAKRFAYAYITPDTAPSRADPVAFVRRVFRTLALDLSQTFQLQPSCYGDIAVRFRTPDDREAAMRRQPFELDGATVTLVREGETSDVIHIEYNYMARVALRNYPVEQRTEEDIAATCVELGFVREIDLGYRGDFTSVVPVEILTLWDRAHSYDADGQHYLPLFQAPTAAA